MNDINLNSKEVIECGMIEKRLASSNIGDTYQFIREGYFCVDRDSTNFKLVFNSTVSLKADINKNAHMNK